MLLPFLLPPAIDLAVEGVKYGINHLGSTGPMPMGYTDYNGYRPYDAVPQYVTQHGGGSCNDASPRPMNDLGAVYLGHSQGIHAISYDQPILPLGAGYPMHPYLGGPGPVATLNPGAISFDQVYDPAPVQTQNGCTCNSILDGVFDKLEQVTAKCGPMPKNGGDVSLKLFNCVQDKMEGDYGVDLVDQSDGTLNHSKIVEYLKETTGLVVPGAEGCIKKFKDTNKGVPLELYKCLVNLCPNARVM